ncbi:MAG: pilus assembly protein [Silicimonas sp.]|nr:pilus assembly protein [Silicimonas sp.]
MTELPTFCHVYAVREFFCLGAAVMSTSRYFRGVRRFRSDEDASVTIEFVLWLPLLCSLFLIATDATMAFMRQSQMWQVSRDTARIFSRHGMTQDVARDYARANAAFGSTVPDVLVETNGSFVVVSIATPASAMTVFGTLNFALGDNITTRVVHAMEPS